MINMILGVSGSGKSYEAVVFHVIPALEKGRQVITNLPLNVEYFRDMMGDDKADLIKLVEPSASNPMPFKTISDFGDTWRMAGDNPIGSLYIIDECHKPFPKGQINPQVDEWFAEHRHELADVLLITQSYGKIWQSIRDNTHIVYRVRKNIALGSSGSYVRKVQDGVRGEVVNQTIRTYEPKYFPFYNSHTKSDTSAKEAFSSDIKPIWQHWTFLLGIPLLLIGLYTLFSSPLPFDPSKKNPISKPQKSALESVPQQTTFNIQTEPTSNKPNIAEPEPMQSKTKDDDKLLPTHPFYKLQMHIGGFVENADKTRFMYNVQLTQNGQLVSEITDKDLLRAGYAVEPMGACLFKVKFANFYDYVNCDFPQVDIRPKDNISIPKSDKSNDKSSQLTVNSPNSAPV